MNLRQRSWCEPEPIGLAGQGKKAFTSMRFPRRVRDDVVRVYESVYFRVQTERLPGKLFHYIFREDFNVLGTFRLVIRACRTLGSFSFFSSFSSFVSWSRRFLWIFPALVWSMFRPFRGLSMKTTAGNTKRYGFFRVLGVHYVHVQKYSHHVKILFPLSSLIGQKKKKHKKIKKKGKKHFHRSIDRHRKRRPVK